MTLLENEKRKGSNLFFFVSYGFYFKFLVSTQFLRAIASF